MEEDAVRVLDHRIRNLFKKRRQIEQKSNLDSKLSLVDSQILGLQKLRESLPFAVEEEINLVRRKKKVVSSSSSPVLKCIRDLIESYPENFETVRSELETLLPRLQSAVQEESNKVLKQISEEANAPNFKVPMLARCNVKLSTPISSYKGFPMYSGSMMQSGRSPFRISAMPLTTPTVNSTIDSYKDEYVHSSLINNYGTTDYEQKMIAVDPVVHIDDYFNTKYQKFIQKGLAGTIAWWNFIKMHMILIFRQLADMMTWFFWKAVTFLDLMDGVFVQDGVEPSLKFLPGRNLLQSQQVSAKIEEMKQNVADFSYKIVQIVGFYAVRTKACNADVTSIRQHITEELSSDHALSTFMHNITKKGDLLGTMLSGALFINPPLFWESGFSFNLLTKLLPRLKEKMIDMPHLKDLIALSKLMKWKKGVLEREEGYPVMRISKYIACFHQYGSPDHIFNFCKAIADHMNDDDDQEGKRLVLEQKLSEADIVVLLQNLIPALLTETHYVLMKYFTAHATGERVENDRRVFGSLVGGEIKREVDRLAEKSAASHDLGTFV